MSTQAPEAPARQAPKKENVLTRKLGPLPTWVWIAIVALLILLYVVFAGNKSKASTQQGQGTQAGGFGAFLQPFTVLRGARGPRGPRGKRGGGGGEEEPPHTKHHHKRGDHDDTNPKDLDFKVGTNRMARDRDRGDPDGRGGGGPGGGGGMGGGGPTPTTVGIDRRVKRGEPVPGWLVGFKTAETGQTPSLSDVANHYDTSPDAIVAEAEGRGYPSSVAWKRYVARHDWASPLPPATDFSILAHPG